MEIQDFAPKKMGSSACIFLIGMAGCGKSTVGKALAEALNWPLVDTDSVIEAHYGTRLQNVADSMTKEEFLDTECTICSCLNVKRCVVPTGGSVVYREKTMEHFATLGVCVYLDVDLPVILERISRNPDRGLAIAPGQSIEDLVNERSALYDKYAQFRLPCTTLSPEECAEQIIAWLKIA